MGFCSFLPQAAVVGLVALTTISSYKNVHNSNNIYVTAFLDANSFPEGTPKALNVLDSTYTHPEDCKNKGAVDPLKCAYEGEMFGYSVTWGNLLGDTSSLGMRWPELIVGAPQWQTSKRPDYCSSGVGTICKRRVKTHQQNQGRVRIYEKGLGNSFNFYIDATPGYTGHIGVDLTEYSRTTNELSDGRSSNRFGTHIMYRTTKEFGEENKFGSVLNVSGVLYVPELQGTKIYALYKTYDGTDKTYTLIHKEFVSIISREGTNHEANLPDCRKTDIDYQFKGFRGLTTTDKYLFSGAYAGSSADNGSGIRKLGTGYFSTLNKKDGTAHFKNIMLMDIGTMGLEEADQVANYGPGDLKCRMYRETWAFGFSSGFNGNLLLTCDLLINNLAGYCAVVDDEIPGKTGSERRAKKWSFKGEGQADSRFGTHAIFGHFTNDDILDVIISEPSYSLGDFHDAGRFYAFKGVEGDSPFEAQPYHIEDGKFNLGRFGTTMANIGDINEDGLDDIAVGVPFANVLNGTNILKHAGAVAIFHARPKTDTQEIGFNWVQTLYGENAYDLFGWSISQKQAKMGGYYHYLVGAPGAEKDGLPKSGKVYVLKNIDYAVAEAVIEANPLVVGAAVPFIVDIKVKCKGPHSTCGDLESIVQFPPLNIMDEFDLIVVPPGCVPNEAQFVCTSRELQENAESVFRFENVKLLTTSTFTLTTGTNDFVKAPSSAQAQVKVDNKADIEIIGDLKAWSAETGSTDSVFKGKHVAVGGIKITNNLGLARNVRVEVQYPEDYYFTYVVYGQPGQSASDVECATGQTSECRAPQSKFSCQVRDKLYCQIRGGDYSTNLGVGETNEFLDTVALYFRPRMGNNPSSVLEFVAKAICLDNTQAFPHVEASLPVDGGSPKPGDILFTGFVKYANPTQCSEGDRIGFGSTFVASFNVINIGNKVSGSLCRFTFILSGDDGNNGLLEQDSLIVRLESMHLELLKKTDIGGGNYKYEYQLRPMEISTYKSINIMGRIASKDNTNFVKFTDITLDFSAEIAEGSSVDSATSVLAGTDPAQLGVCYEHAIKIISFGFDWDTTTQLTKPPWASESNFFYLPDDGTTIGLSATIYNSGPANLNVQSTVFFDSLCSNAFGDFPDCLGNLIPNNIPIEAINVGEIVYCKTASPLNIENSLSMAKATVVVSYEEGGVNVETIASHDIKFHTGADLSISGNSLTELNPNRENRLSIQIQNSAISPQAAVSEYTLEWIISNSLSYVAEGADPNSNLNDVKYCGEPENITIEVLGEEIDAFKYTCKYTEPISSNSNIRKYILIKINEDVATSSDVLNFVSVQVKDVKPSDSPQHKYRPKLKEWTPTSPDIYDVALQLVTNTIQSWGSSQQVQVIISNKGNVPLGEDDLIYVKLEYNNFTHPFSQTGAASEVDLPCKNKDETCGDKACPDALTPQCGEDENNVHKCYLECYVKAQLGQESTPKTLKWTFPVSDDELAKDKPFTFASVVSIKKEDPSRLGNNRGFVNGKVSSPECDLLLEFDRDINDKHFSEAIGYMTLKTMNLKIDEAKDVIITLKNSDFNKWKLSYNKSENTDIISVDKTNVPGTTAETWEISVRNVPGSKTEWIVAKLTVEGGVWLYGDVDKVDLEITASISNSITDVNSENNEVSAIVYLYPQPPAIASGLSTTDIIILIIIVFVLVYIFINIIIVMYFSKFFQRAPPPTEELFEEATMEELDS